MPKLITVNQLNKKSIIDAFDLNQRTEKIVTFIFPSVMKGAFGPFCKFPLSGTIKKIEAYCEGVGSVNTVFTIEKSTPSLLQKFTVDEQQFAIDIASMKSKYSEELQDSKTLVDVDIPTSILISPWKSILSMNVVIPKLNNFQDNTYQISDAKINANDLLRVDFLQTGFESPSQKIISNLTIQVIIETNDNT